MTRIIILAAGKGVRMNSELPKVLVPLKGRPMIKYLLDAVVAANIDPRPLVIVSPDNKKIISEALKDYNLEYVIQKEQLGTGHAVACAQEALKQSVEKVQNLIVLYGDHPFLKSDSIKKMAAANIDVLTLLPTNLPNFSGWHQNFYHWGRIVRGGDSKIEKIVEFKDANDKEKLITEVNPGFMGFRIKWLFENIPSLNNNNKQKEYYLTDMVELAFDAGQNIGTIDIAPYEAMGVNSLEELKIAENLLS